MSDHHTLSGTACDWCGKVAVCAVFHDSVLCADCEKGLDE